MKAVILILIETKIKLTSKSLPTPTLLPTTIRYLLLYNLFLASTIQGIKSSNQVVIEVCEVLSTTD